jgi:hypothetical protein
MPDPAAGLPPRFPANAGSRTFPQPLRPHPREAPNLRYRPDLSEDRRPCRLRRRRPEGLGRPRRQDVDLRSRHGDCAACKAAHEPARRMRLGVADCRPVRDHSAQKHVSERDQLDLFRALPGDLAPRDAQDLMAYPFFSLAKSKRVQPIDFRPHGRNTGRGRARARHGDHLGCRRSDLGRLADRRGPRRRLEDLASDGCHTRTRS